MQITAYKYRISFVYLILALTPLAVFWQVRTFDFTNYDDDRYVTENPHIATGLTFNNIIWVLTHKHTYTWHPLTSLSLMLDCQLFGLNPGLSHIINLLFHIANTLLLFAALKKMTGALWQSAFVTALFALHPLHVESVAWISERKDLLSTLFWFLTIAAYFRYVKKPGLSSYTLTLILFALGLMSKPMLVTLPFVLLLLDYWPLNRLEFKNSGQIYSLIWEKIPLFALSAVSSIITFFVQKSGGAIRQMEVFSLKVRAANALVSYAKYIVKMIWPSHLAAFYPHPGNNLPARQVVASIILLMIVTVFVIRFAAKYRYLPVGWFWFLGTLVPVIGFIQVGDQAMADRYTYIPLVGLFIIVAWGANDLLEKYRFRKIILTVSSSIIILILSVCTFLQTGYWRNSRSLFEHSLNVTGPNYVALVNLGTVLFNEGNVADAMNHWNRALQIKPGFAEVYNGLAMAYAKLDRWDDAIEMCTKAIKSRPDFAPAYNNLGNIYGQLDRHQDAIQAFKQAIQIKPDFVDARYNLVIAYMIAGDKDSALAEYQILKTLSPAKASEILKQGRKNKPE